MIDLGSELLFISEELIHRLRLKRKPTSFPLQGIGGIYSGRIRGVVSLRFQSIYEISENCDIITYILRKLTTKLPSVVATQEVWSHLHGLPLADPDFLRRRSIQIIIGVNYYGQIIKPDLVKGDLESPRIQRSIFGWIISGPVKTADHVTCIQEYHYTIDEKLYELLSRFWTQEEFLSSAKHSLNPDETKCETHFVQNVSQDSSGRYIVRLPLKISINHLGTSSLQALSCLSHRFKANPTYRERYSEFI